MAVTKQRRPDLILFTIVIILAGLGLVMVLSASSVIGFQAEHDPFHYFRRQAIWLGLGMLLLIVTMNVDYHVYRKLALPGIVVAFVLLLLVLWIGQEIGGARRWISLGFFNLQPSEVTKLAMVNFAAVYIATKGRKIRRLFSGLLPILVILAGAFGLIILEPDFGTAAALMATVMLMLFAGGAYLGHLMLLAIGAGAGLYQLALGWSYRWRRITAFLDPWADPMDTGWNVIQSLLAVGSGGLLGVGLGNSRQKFSYLPEHHTDFIYAILAEDLGFIGAGAVVVLYVMLVWRGYAIGLRARDTYGSLLAVGLTTMLAFQALLNIGVATGSVPVTGIPLPFVSYGGSALMTAMASAGVLLNISKQGRVTRKKLQEGMDP